MEFDIVWFTGTIRHALFGLQISQSQYFSMLDCEMNISILFDIIYINMTNTRRRCTLLFH